MKNYFLGIYLIILLILFYLLYNQKYDAVEPNLFLNKKISKANRIKMKVHSVHHTNETMKKLSKRLEDGVPWEEAHADLKKIKLDGHLRHVNIEMNRILLESFYITVGTITGLLSVNLYQYVLTFYDDIIWKGGISLCFFLSILLILSAASMKLKHNLSFSSYDETLFY